MEGEVSFGLCGNLQACPLASFLLAVHKVLEEAESLGDSYTPFRLPVYPSLLHTSTSGLSYLSPCIDCWSILPRSMHRLLVYPSLVFLSTSGSPPSVYASISSLSFLSLLYQFPVNPPSVHASTAGLFFLCLCINFWSILPQSMHRLPVYPACQP